MKNDDEKYETIVSLRGNVIEWVKFGDEIKYFDRSLNDKQKDNKIDEPIWIKPDLESAGKNSEN